MIRKAIKKATGRSEKKTYRQVQISIGGRKEKMQFTADIPEDGDELEKVEELFEKVYTQMKQIEFYEENK